MENMKVMNLKELGKAGGGLIVETKGKYYASGDEVDSCYWTIPLDTLEEAVAMCRRYDWRTNVMTEKEYYDKFKAEFEV